MLTICREFGAVAIKRAELMLDLGWTKAKQEALMFAGMPFAISGKGCFMV